MIPLLTKKLEQEFQKQLRQVNLHKHQERIANNASKKQKKKKSKKKIDKCDFPQTPLGYLLIHECPLEFGVLHDLCTEAKVKLNANLVNSFAVNSKNPIFHTIKFREALRDFRIYGLRTPNAIPFNLENELSYIYRKYDNEKIETELLLV